MVTLYTNVYGGRLTGDKVKSNKIVWSLWEEVTYTVFKPFTSPQ